MSPELWPVIASGLQDLVDDTIKVEVIEDSKFIYINISKDGEKRLVLRPPISHFLASFHPIESFRNSLESLTTPDHPRFFRSQTFDLNDPKCFDEIVNLITHVCSFSGDAKLPQERDSKCHYGRNSIHGSVKRQSRPKSQNNSTA
jgi:hypothetical protein